MKHYTSHRAEPFFTQMKKGEKSIEGRLNKSWRKKVKTGDYITINNNDETDSFESEVIAVRRYRSFYELLVNEKLYKLLPGVKSIDEGLAIYRNFYTIEQEEQFGVVAIEVKVL
jgi:ASC-1-like (ASCH) protein